MTNEMTLTDGEMKAESEDIELLLSQLRMADLMR